MLVSIIGVLGWHYLSEWIDSKAVIILTLRGRRLVTDHQNGARVASKSCLAARIGPKGPCQFELSIRGCSQSFGGIFYQPKTPLMETNMNTLCYQHRIDGYVNEAFE